MPRACGPLSRHTSGARSSCASTMGRHPGARSSPVSQPFPGTSSNAIIVNQPLAAMLARLRDSRETLYCYIVATISNDHGRYCQEGSAPNFQGDVMTLCSCKHSMRALWGAPAWQGKWIAGVTGWNVAWDRHYLVYLMQIGSAYRSPAAIYRALTSAAQQAKAADANRLGDLYRPKDEMVDEDDPNNYVRPMDGHTHCKHNGWREDISYRDRLGRRSAYLAGAPACSFLWDRPQIIADVTLQRGHLRFDPGGDFARLLRSA
jgi:hypothetical protein